MINNTGKQVKTVKSDTVSDLAKEIERLKAENEQPKIKSSRKQQLSCKVSQKGAVSIYGFGRFPVTLYREQWERLIDFIPDLVDFIEENRDQLSVKQ